MSGKFSKLRLIALVMLMPLAVTAPAKTPLEAGRDLIVRYGVNPGYQALSSVKNPYGDDSEDAHVGAGWYVNLPDGETYAVTVADERFIQNVAYERQSIREELRQLNYPVNIDGVGMTIQYAYFDDETASCVYFYICDESVHDMNQKMRESDLNKMLLKNTILKKIDVERFLYAHVNIKYVYIGNKSGLTSYMTFGWDELRDYFIENR